MIVTPSLVSPLRLPRNGRRAVALQEAVVAVFFGLYLCFVFIGSRPYQNSLVADSSGETDILRQLFVFASFALAALVFLSERQHERRMIVVLMCVFFFAGFLLCSSLWSQHPSFVIRRAGMFLLTAPALCVLVDYLHRVQLLLPTIVIVLMTVLVIDCLSMLLLYNLSIDHDGRWKGIHIHKNVAGSIMALTAITFSWLAVAGNRSLWPVAAMAAIFLFMTASKTSFALMFGSMAIMAAIVSLRVLWNIGGLWATLPGVAFIGGGALIYDMSTLTNTVIGALYGDVTLTGRVFIWDYVLSKHGESPWLGYGYGSFWGMGEQTPAISEDVPLVRDFNQAHNGYLDILVQTGWTGFALFGLLLGGVLLTAVRRVIIATGDWKLQALALNIVLFVMLHNLLESTWLTGLSVEWTLFFIMSLYIILNTSQTHAQPPADLRRVTPQHQATSTSRPQMELVKNQ